MESSRIRWWQYQKLYLWKVHMAYEIIYDADKGVAALIDPVIGRALGPVAMGDNAVHVLEQFVGAIGVDPATHTPAKLEHMWSDFVDALADADEVLAADAVSGGGEPPGEPGAAVEAGPDISDKVAPSEPLPTGPIPSESATAGEVPATREPSEALSASEADATPVTNPQPGHIVCPTCDGWRTITQGGTEVTCPTCNGAGEILEAQPEPTGGAAAV